jgi:anti-sigma-K factor RskA
MSDPARDRFDDLKYAYALGALTESERREFESYLREHPELQAEVDDLDSVANLLALAPQEYEPSPELRRNLLSRIRGSPGAPLDDSSPFWVRLRGLFDAGGRTAVAAAAVLAVVGLLVWNVFLHSENETLQGELQEQQTYELQGKGAARDVSGEVVRVRAGRAVLVAENLPPLPEGRIYEIWLLRGGVPEPAGLFEPRDGETTAAPIEGSLNGADAVAVTVEPSGGSSTPTSEPSVTASLS